MSHAVESFGNSFIREGIINDNRLNQLPDFDSTAFDLCLFCTFFVATAMVLKQADGGAMNDEAVSNLKCDERIVFFTTDAQRTSDGKNWKIPIQVWVYEYEKARVRTAAIAAALRVRYSLKTSDDTATNFERRSRLIAADNERGKRIVIEVADQTIVLPETKPNGHAAAEFELSTESVAEHVRDGYLEFTAKLPADDDRFFSGTVRLVPVKGISVISDFDDTVKITYAYDRAKMLHSTLYKDYEPVPGMAKVYASWAAQGATIHFVSSSPWHLYEPIQEFLDENGFPWRTLSLKSFRFKDSSLLNLFRKGTETKPDQIYPILRAYPQRQFVLIGDSGQHDPEVYAAVVRDFPHQIAMVYIRNVPGASADADRFRAVFKDIPQSKWRLFESSDELKLPRFQ